MSNKTVLCYGDSNTYGLMPMTSPASSARFAVGERWTSVVQNRLGHKFSLIEEGLCARTTVHNDPIEGLHKNGLEYLLPCLESHCPIDIVILMLGTNDLKQRFSVEPADIMMSIKKLLDIVRLAQIGPNRTCPDILLMAPVPIEEIGFLGDIFVGGAEKSRRLSGLYRQIAEDMGIAFLDAGDYAQCSPVDGVHFDAQQHQTLGQAVANLILEQFCAT